MYYLLDGNGGEVPILQPHRQMLQQLAGSGDALLRDVVHKVVARNEDILRRGALIARDEVLAQAGIVELDQGADGFVEACSVPRSCLLALCCDVDQVQRKDFPN